MTERQPIKDQEKRAAEAEPISAADAAMDRKKRILWLAVGGLTAAIVLLWVLLLPLQVREMKFGSLSDLTDRWRVVRDESRSTASFRETLNRIHDRLVNSSPKTQAADALNGAGISDVDVARLREKLETVGQIEDKLIVPANAAPQDQGTK